MAVTLIKAIWEGGNQVFRRVSDGAAIASLTPDGLVIHSLESGASSADDLYLSGFVVADPEDDTTIWNDEGDLKLSVDPN